MKITLILVCCLVMTIVVLFFILGMMSKKGAALGLVEGNLSNCSDKPNCVCSEYKDDSDHYITPLTLAQNSNVDALTDLKQIIAEMGGTLQAENSTYLAATFSSTIFGFVDDVEINIDRKQGLIQLRSASRVGHSDMGANKKRVELLKQLYLEKSVE